MHPYDEVIANMKAVGSKIYSTAQDGTIVVTTNGSTYSINAPVKVPPVSEPVKESYKNCTVLRKVYPDGVRVGHTAYDSNHDDDNDGWACEPFKETNTSEPPPQPEPVPTPMKEYFKNCTELNKVYPNGVDSSHPAYDKKMERDGDGGAWEK